MKGHDLLSGTDVVILCGGAGSRLGDMTRDRPKPMMTIGGKPFLDILIGYVESFGFRRFVLCVGHGKEAVKDYFRSFQSGVEIVYSEETEGNLLGTAGAIKNAEEWIKSRNYMVMNGDSFARIDLGAFFQFHERKRAAGSVALVKSSGRTDAGLARINGREEIVSFREKSETAGELFMNGGIYCFGRDLFGRIPDGTGSSLEYDILPSMIGSGLYGYVCEAEVIDIGTPERLDLARDYFGGGREG